MATSLASPRIGSKTPHQCRFALAEPLLDVGRVQEAPPAVLTP